MSDEAQESHEEATETHEEAARQPPPATVPPVQPKPNEGTDGGGARAPGSE